MGFYSLSVSKKLSFSFAFRYCRLICYFDETLNHVAIKKWADHQESNSQPFTLNLTSSTVWQFYLCFQKPS